MNLNALDTNLGKILNSYARKYHLPSASTLTSQILTKAIILCEGTPDNFAVALASHKINGSETAAITKPLNKTNTATFELMRLFITQNRSLRGLLFILDQEEDSLTNISHEFEKQIRKNVNTYECSQVDFEERLKVYECLCGERKLVLILVINGHPDIRARKHMIEDHFLKITAKLEAVAIPEKMDNPKDYWQNKINPHLREATLRALVENDTLIAEFFPQQCRGLEVLKSIK